MARQMMRKRFSAYMTGKESRGLPVWMGLLPV